MSASEKPIFSISWTLIQWPNLKTAVAWFGESQNPPRLFSVGDFEVRLALIRYPRNLHLPARLLAVLEGRFAMNKLASVVFIVALSMGPLNLASADQPGPDWMPAQKVIEQFSSRAIRRLTRLKPMTADGKAKASRTARRWTFTPIRRPA